MINDNKSPTVSLKAMQSNNSSPKTDNSEVDQLLVKTNNTKDISDEKTTIGSQNAKINENKCKENFFFILNMYESFS